MSTSSLNSLDSYPKLLSLAVHELRTPASVVGGYLRMLQRDGESALSERQRKMVDEAEKSCQRLVAIVAEISDVAKLDAGLLSLAHQPFDLFAAIGELAALVHEAEDRDVRLQLRGDADGARLTGDTTRLGRAFDAIFRSILREKAGPAIVAVDRRRDTIDGRPWAVVVVADESKVQAAYTAPRGEFDEKRGGLGLALPLARRVIEKHGGRIWAPADDALARSSAIVAIPIE